MKQPDFYIKLLLVIIIPAILGIAWKYPDRIDSQEAQGIHHDALYDHAAHDEGSEGTEVCKALMSLEDKKIASLNSHQSCEPFTLPYDRIVYARAHDYNVEPSLVNAVITIESNWNPQAISRKGAIGLMQLMPATAKEMGVHDPFNPAENIEGGIRYLRYLMDRFDGDLTLAVAAYNAGPNRIATYQAIPPFRETQRYVKRVLALYYSTAHSNAI